MTSLEQYFSDQKATDALENAQSDPQAAKEALVIAADYIRRGLPLPGNLADHVAGAIPAAAHHSSPRPPERKIPHQAGVVPGHLLVAGVFNHEPANLLKR